MPFRSTAAKDELLRNEAGRRGIIGHLSRSKGRRRRLPARNHARVTRYEADIAIVGAGMAGASLAAMIGSRARVLLIEGEQQPGYHATGRSAAFWSETYGGPIVQPLTTASGPWLSAGGYLGPRGCVHIADANGRAELDTLIADMGRGGVTGVPLDRTALEAIIPGLAQGFAWGMDEPTCRDIDVGRLHADYLAMARRAGTTPLLDAAVMAIERGPAGWRLETKAGPVEAKILVNAAGAWADDLARLAGAAPLGVQPYRRTIIQLAIGPICRPARPPHPRSGVEPPEMVASTRKRGSTVAGSATTRRRRQAGPPPLAIDWRTSTTFEPADRAVAGDHRLTRASPDRSGHSRAPRPAGSAPCPPSGRVTSWALNR
jgi:glycine/D-amino acid oxidase-like deaminating enzyme